MTAMGRPRLQTMEVRESKTAGPRSVVGRPRRTGPWRLELYRLCDRERILKFDAEVAHGAVHLCVAKQELNCS